MSQYLVTENVTEFFSQIGQSVTTACVRRFTCVARRTRCVLRLCRAFKGKPFTYTGGLAGDASGRPGITYPFLITYFIGLILALQMRV